MTYDKLYNNMVKKFTIANLGQDYKLGEYMLMKAKVKRHEAEKAEAIAKTDATANLPVKVERHQDTNAIASVISFVNEKLAVKEAPAQDKTIRSFPLRTSFTAFCSAIVVCALVISSSIIGAAPASANDNTVREDSHITEELTEANELKLADVHFEYEE
jgi:hypothetical protein